MKKNTSEAIRQANVANIVKKVKSGKTLSAREQELATKYFEEKENESENEGNVKQNLCVNVITVAEFFGVSDRQVRRWARLGMPKEDKGIYDLKKCFDWWKENITPQVTEEEKEIRKRYWTAKADFESIKVQKLKGQLIDRDEIFNEFTMRASDLKISLRSLKYRLVGVLEGKGRDEMMQVIGNEVDEMLRNYCRSKSFLGNEKRKSKVKK